MMTVKTEITLTHIGYQDAKVGSEKLVIENIFNRQNLVRIKYGMVDISVHKAELLKAIMNATNNENLT